MIAGETTTIITKPVVNILVVDDSLICRNMICKSLTSISTENFTICCDQAGNGEIALTIIKNKLEDNSLSDVDISANLTGTNMHDIIFIDYEMPYMNGTTTIQAIRKTGYTGKIIGLTGNIDNDSMIEAGADEVLLKPVSLAELKNVVMNEIHLKIKDI